MKHACERGSSYKGVTVNEAVRELGRNMRSVHQMKDQGGMLQ